MIGFGVMAGGFSVINWGKLAAVVISWIISPVFSLIISLLMFKFIIKVIISRKDSFIRSLKWSPFFIGITLFVVVLSFLFKTPLGKRLSLSTPMSLVIASILAVILSIIGMKALKFFIRPEKSNSAEEVFRFIQVGTSCYVALAQGANDVANAVGPLAVIYFIVKTGSVGSKVQVPTFLLLFGGIGILCGIWMAGYRVMDTLGKKITTLTNTRGFSVDFAAATTVLIASKMGLPVSTTHAAVGGVMGVGIARGIEAINFSIIFKIMIYWVLTVPVAAVTSMIIFKILQLII
jgi:PiT family inorganic phosphate transporter